jgi:hypothetical protein
VPAPSGVRLWARLRPVRSIDDRDHGVGPERRRVGLQQGVSAARARRAAPHAHGGATALGRPCGCCGCLWLRHRSAARDGDRDVNRGRNRRKQCRCRCIHWVRARSLLHVKMRWFAAGIGATCCACSSHQCRRQCRCRWWHLRAATAGAGHPPTVRIQSYTTHFTATLSNLSSARVYTAPRWLHTPLDRLASAALPRPNRR